MVKIPENLFRQSSNSGVVNEVSKILRSLPEDAPIPSSLQVKFAELKLNLANQIELSLPDELIKLNKEVNNNASIETRIIQKAPQIILQIKITEKLLNLSKNEAPTKIEKNPINLLSLAKSNEVPSKSEQPLSSKEFLLKIIQSNNNQVIAELTADKNTLKQLPVKLLPILVKLETISKSMPLQTDNENTQKVSKPVLNTQPIVIQNDAGTQLKPINSQNSNQIWPQHQKMETLSLSNLIQSLSQLTSKLPIEKLPQEFQIIQRWLNKLISQFDSRFSSEQMTTHNRSISQPTVNSASIKSMIHSQNVFVESELQSFTNNPKEIGDKALLIQQNIKSQIIKILQAFPFLIDKYHPNQETGLKLDGSELWQVIFKVQKILNQIHSQLIPINLQTETMQLSSAWLEQTFKLLTHWLKTVETHQLEHLVVQNQSSGILRYDLPFQYKDSVNWVQVNLQQHNKNSKGKSKQWPWQISLNFNFGDQKILMVNTKIHQKKLKVIFKGTPYFESKLNTIELKSFSERMSQTTALDTEAKFEPLPQSISKSPDDGLHLEA